MSEIDTSTAAVQRLAEIHTADARVCAGAGSRCRLRERTAAMLTALAGERDAAVADALRLRESRDAWVDQHRRAEGERDAARAEAARLREALFKLERWGSCFIENTPITAETLWREFPLAIKDARAALGQESAT